MIRVHSPDYVAMSFRLTIIQDSMINGQDCLELGLLRADIRRELGRG